MSAVTRILGRMVRETGQALEVLGVLAVDEKIHLDHFSRHRNIMSISDFKPSLSDTAWVAPTANVIGNVNLSEHASVWYGAVVRGDEAPVSIGSRSNVQDDSIIGGSKATELGEDVTVGHGAIISSSRIGDRCLIGMKAILDNVDISSDSIIAAGAVLRPGSKVLSGQMWAGNPAAFKRVLTDKEMSYLAESAMSYSNLATSHKKEDDSIRKKLAEM